MEDIHLKLPFLLRPKTNRYIKGSNRVYLPSSFKEEIDKAVEIFKKKNIKTVTEAFSLEAVFYQKDRRNRDLDNMTKSLLDCLEKSKIIKNDSLAYSLHLRKEFSDKNEIKIKISKPRKGVKFRKYTFELPFLLRPKTNRYYRSKKRSFLPKEYSSQIEKAYLYLRKQRAIFNFLKIDAPIAASVEIWVPDYRKRDLDNYFKSIFDLLKKIKLIKDDRDIFEIDAVKRVIKKEERTIISIGEL